MREIADSAAVAVEGELRAEEGELRAEELAAADLVVVHTDHLVTTPP